MNRRVIIIAGGAAALGCAALFRPALVPSAPPARVQPPLDASSDTAEPAVARTSGPTVYVVGAVRRPGVFALAPGARIDAAVRAAGGLGPAADPVAIDLASYARDGERIVVPRLGETPGPAGFADGAAVDDAAASDPVADASAADTESPRPKRRRSHRKRRRRHHAAAGAPDAESSVPGDARGEPLAATAPVDINTADAGVLATLPGVGDGLAERIVRFRETSGPFVRPEELLDVNGMTDRIYDRISASIAI